MTATIHLNHDPEVPTRVITLPQAEDDTQQSPTRTRRKLARMQIRLLARIQPVWELLTRPHVSFETADRRRKVRSASAIILLTTIIFAMELFLFSPLPQIVIPVGLLVGCYLLSRTHYVTLAVIGTMVAVSLEIVWWVMGITDWQKTTLLAYFAWLQLPILLGALLLSPLATLRLAFVTNLGMMLLHPVVIPNVPPSQFGSAAGFLMTVSAVIVGAAYLQEYYFVRPQLAEVNRAHQALETKNRELQGANREIRDYSYIIAHDLRSPLVNILEFVKEIRYALDTLEPAIQAGIPLIAADQQSSAQTAVQTDLPEALSYLETSSVRMQQLIAEILKLARAGQRDLTLVPIDLNQMVNELLVDFSHRIDYTHTQITLRLPSTPVYADRLIVEQVLINLIDNGLKYLLPERPGQIEVAAQIGLRETVISVRDNGRGIARQDFDKVLQPFRRAGNVNGVDGLGVGLYYAQSLIERQGGQLWFESQPDVGTVFHFSIPTSTLAKHSQ